MSDNENDASKKAKTKTSQGDNSNVSNFELTDSMKTTIDQIVAERVKAYIGGAGAALGATSDVAAGIHTQRNLLDDAKKAAIITRLDTLLSKIDGRIDEIEKFKARMKTDPNL